jgi:Kdo2-lipid IVA lauroyltransferase/acyltransferase
MKPLKKRIKNNVIYAFVLIVVKIIRWLPRRVAIGGMRGLARLAFTAVKREREKTIRHLTQALPERSGESRRLAKGVFLTLATAAVDAIRIPKYLPDGLNRLVTVKGRQYLDQATRDGKGVIVLTGHFGCWELMGAWLVNNGYPLKVVAKPTYDPRLDKMIVDTRNAAGYTNIARGKNTREIIRALKDGYSLALLVDQDTSVQGVFVKFFDHWAHTATSPVTLAQKFDIAIVPMFMALRPDFRYELVVEPPIELQTTGDKKCDLIVNTQRVSDAYERIIRAYPDQWAWMHERWKKQPTEQEIAGYPC